jgi:hypothetical protein
MKGAPNQKTKQIAQDIESVAFLSARLNEFLASMGSGIPIGSLGSQVTEAVSKVFLSLNQEWEPVPDLDPAEKSIVNFFDPFLEAASLPELMASGARTLTTRNSFIQSMTIACAPVFTGVESVLANSGFPQDQTNLVLGVTIGTATLCAFPLWTVYHDFHGLVAYEKVLPRLRESLRVAELILNDVSASVLASIPSFTVQLGRLDQVLSHLNSSLRQALLQKSGPYLAAFAANAEANFKARTRIKEADLNARIEGVTFWHNEAGGEPKISLGRAPIDPQARAFPYFGGIFLKADDSVQQRSFFALQNAWDALEQAGRFVSQAGFWLYVNAANNPYGGKHPPHQTHQDGGDFDLGWTFIRDKLFDPQDSVYRKDPADKGEKNQHENLARMQKKQPPAPGSVIFVDPATRKEFSLEAVPQDKNKPPTHAAIQKLAVHVVLQAVALSGFQRYLYADADNMRYAATNLELAMGHLAGKLGLADPHLNPWESTQKAVIAFTEGMVHYNHLHAELFAQKVIPMGPFLDKKNIVATLTFLYQLARERDQNNDFYKEMLQPRKNVENNKKDESEDRIKPFRDEWKKRSEVGLPSLLPVWLSVEQIEEFMGFH